MGRKKSKGMPENAGKANPVTKAKNPITGVFSPKLSNTVIIAILVALAFILFVFYVMVKPIPPPVNTSYSGPLTPVVGLKLLPGEKYTYEWRDSQLGNVRVYNTVNERADGCIFVTIEARNMSFPFCLDEATGEPRMLQGAAQGLTPQLTQPWMLALKENWTWNSGLNTTVEWLGSAETVTSRSSYAVAAIGSVKGRTAFKVIVEASVSRISNGKEYPTENGTQTIWVDAEKRVLLYAGSKEGYVELVEAPFKMEPYSEPK